MQPQRLPTRLEDLDDGEPPETSTSVPEEPAPVEEPAQAEGGLPEVNWHQVQQLMAAELQTDRPALAAAWATAVVQFQQGVLTVRAEPGAATTLMADREQLLARLRHHTRQRALALVITKDPTLVPAPESRPLSPEEVLALMATENPALGILIEKFQARIKF